MKIARKSSEPRIDASIGLRIGHDGSEGIGLGLPNSSRQAELVELTGFHSAIVRSTVGMPSVGTKAFEMKVNGKKKTKPTTFAVSVVRANMPTTAPTQIIANPKRSNRPKAASAS